MNNIVAKPDIDVAIIGGGPAGLAAAIGACNAGVDPDRVLILERGERLGGILPQCIHHGFGLHRFKEELTGPEYADRFIRKVERLGVKVLLDTMVIELGADRHITAVSDRYGLVSLVPGAVILAMGCRERTRAQIRIPGTRPAGIFTAGTAQRLVNIEGYLPGRRAVIVGSGDIGLIMARRLAIEGVEVAGVFEILPYPGGLVRNIVQCLDDFGIPLYLSHTVIEIHGKDRVTGVTVAEVDNGGNPVPGSERYIQCDTVLLSVGLIPENELSRMAGVEIDPLTGGPAVTGDFQTSVSGIFACGNVLHVNELVDDVSDEGERAGREAGLYAMEATHATEATRPHLGGRLEFGRPGIQQVQRRRVAARLKARAGSGSKSSSIASSSNSIAGGIASKAAHGDSMQVICTICPVGCEIEVRKMATATAMPTAMAMATAATAGEAAGALAGAGADGGGETEGLEVKGNKCKRGVAYAMEEFTAPKRTLTTTVRAKVAGGPDVFIPVRTSSPIPRDLLLPAARELARVEVREPLEIGDIIVGDILGSGVDVIATASLHVGPGHDHDVDIVPGHAGYDGMVPGHEGAL
ncbi:MAG: FAD-dependent oxidoreductase [Firmicutes bacterium]|nr:FAD-dependent oxidoreductase [Bacillota bacterium]